MSPTEPRSKRLREKQGDDDANKKMRATKTPRRWKAHQIAQDYVDLSSNMMLHPLSNLGPYGYTQQNNRNSTSTTKVSYPLEHMSVLGYLKNPVRKPTVIERWSPYEIACFEASVAEYGKDFYKIQGEIGSTKTTKDVIEFYYIWKKTTHYTKWKAEYVPPYLDVSEDDETDVKNAPKAKA